MRETSRPGRESGSTLVETLIAMVLISFLTLSMVPVLVVGLEVSAVSARMTDALTAGTQQMEVLRTAAFDAPALAPGGSLTESVDGYSSDRVDGDDRLFLRWRIEDLSAHMKRIQVLAGERTTVMGRPREILLDTYRTDLR